MRRLAAIGILTATACSGQAREIQRSAMVPHPAPIARTGQPLVGSAEITAGTGAGLALARPRQGDPDAGLVTPRLQADLAGRVRSLALPDLDFGLVYRRSFAAGSRRISQDIPNPDRDAATYGVSMAGSLGTRDPRLRLALAGELTLMSLPFVVFQTSVEDTGTVSQVVVSEETALVPCVAASVIPSYATTDRITVFGGLTARNHPSIDKRTTVVGRDVGGPDAGPLILIFNVGIDVAVSEHLRGAVSVYQVLHGDPIAYSPTFSAHLTVPLGRRSSEGLTRP
jgi:hypothetical protein